MFAYFFRTLSLTNSRSLGNVYNIGTNFEISNLEVAKQLISLFGLDEKEHLMFVENRPFNDCRYKINSDKLGALGWKPEVSWEEGLRRTSMNRARSGFEWDDVND